MPMLPDLRSGITPVSDDEPVSSSAQLARLLGYTVGSATAHVLAACEVGGYSDLEALRRAYPDLVRAWEAWRRNAAPHRWETPTGAQVRAALRRAGIAHADATGEVSSRPR